MDALWICSVISKPLGLQNKYRSLIAWLVGRCELFDGAYYLESNGDVARLKLSPLDHYVAYGDREGRFPMALFDPSYYRMHARGRSKHVNALLHYVYVGRYRQISPSPWFDVSYYLSNNKDVARAGLDPLLHYLHWGGIEGRSPCMQFDGHYYLSFNQDVAGARINPLLHYLQAGRKENRRALPPEQTDICDEEMTGLLPIPTLPSWDLWSQLTPRSGIGDARIDVVVPVYKGRSETLRCLLSVLLAECAIPYELIVINDQSPDDELVEDLKKLANQGLFTLLTNSENYGFVRTVNIGMQLHKNRNIVLLNADAEVYDHWLDRLHSAASRNQKTGTVTPLSNNATICSYPRFIHDNPYPLEIEYAELNSLMAQVNDKVEVEAPTGVGFCLYIKRACLNSVGLFDEKAFGKGYGEENDFCQRAIAKGWRNIIASDIFVRHWGSASFQGERGKRVQAALKVLDKRYPRYQKDVSEFIKCDPLAESRKRADWARLLLKRKEKNVLIVCHNRGGGTERHVQEDIQRLSSQGYGVFLLRPMQRRPSHVVLSHPTIKLVPNIPAFDLTSIESLKEALSQLGISELHTHSLVDFLPKAPRYLKTLVEMLGIKWEINIHDYKVICPRINLADENGYYCGEEGDSKCNRCLLELGSHFKVRDIRKWRAMHSDVLRAAETILVPDVDVADRLGKYYPGIEFQVSPHELIVLDDGPRQIPELQADEVMRVVVIGAIGKLKGFDVLLACAIDARMRRLPLKFILMGYSMDDRLLLEEGVQISGKYHEHEAINVLNSLNPHLVWLPSLWPETYSYTLSIALQANYPVMAFDIGAIASRLRRYQQSNLLVPLEMSHRIKELNDFILNQRRGTDAG